ncbi:MAG TPA: hypothetical protein VF009_06900 [Solirubrobacterales bacterium]
MPIIVAPTPQGMTFKELYEEAAERGFNDLLRSEAQKARLKRWVNQAIREIIDIAPWPFLETVIEGSAPLLAENLGHVLSVTNRTTETVLTFSDRRLVVGRDPALDNTGVAEQWYLEGGNTIHTYPLDSSANLRVRYVQAPVELKADDERTIIPFAYQDLIIDGTVIRAYKNRDEFEAAQFTRQEWERGIKGLTHALLKPNYDNEKTIVRTGAPADYLG